MCMPKILVRLFEPKTGRRERRDGFCHEKNVSNARQQTNSTRVDKLSSEGKKTQRAREQVIHVSKRYIMASFGEDRPKINCCQGRRANGGQIGQILKRQILKLAMS